MRDQLVSSVTVKLGRAWSSSLITGQGMALLAHCWGNPPVMYERSISILSHSEAWQGVELLTNYWTGHGITGTLCGHHGD